MLYGLLLTVLVIILGMIQGYVLYHKKLFLELYISITFIVIALIYSYSYIYTWNVPSPSAFIGLIFEGISKMVFGYNFK